MGAVQTCDERLRLTAACEVGHGTLHETDSHLSTNQVGHCGTDQKQSNEETLHVKSSGKDAEKVDSLGQILVKISG